MMRYCLRCKWLGRKVAWKYTDDGPLPIACCPKCRSAHLANEDGEVDC